MGGVRGLRIHRIQYLTINPGKVIHTAPRTEENRHKKINKIKLCNMHINMYTQETYIRLYIEKCPYKCTQKCA